MIKIVNLEQNTILNWIETSSNKETKYCNYIAKFSFQQSIEVGFISFIGKNSEEEIILGVKTIEIGRLSGYEVNIKRISTGNNYKCT